MKVILALIAAALWFNYLAILSHAQKNDTLSRMSTFDAIVMEQQDQRQREIILALRDIADALKCVAPKRVILH